MNRLTIIAATLLSSLAVAFVALALLTSGCKFHEADVAPDRVAEFAEKKEAVQKTNLALAEASKEYEAAFLANDATRMEAAKTKLEAASAAHAESVESYAAFEDDVVQKKVGGFVGFLASIHPSLAWASPLLIPIANVFTPRGSKHALQAIKDLPRLLKGKPDVILDVLKLMGLLHSTPETAQVAKATIGKQQAATA